MDNGHPNYFSLLTPSSDGTYKVSLLHYQMATNSEVNRNLACVINNCNNSSY